MKLEVRGMGAKYFQFHVTNFSEAQIASKMFSVFPYFKEEKNTLKQVYVNEVHLTQQPQLNYM